MKEKIIQKIRELFPNVNLSKERLDAIADKLAAKITEEDQIEERVNDLNEVVPFAEIAKQDDRVRTLEAEVKKKAANPTDPPNPTNDPPTDPPKPTDDTPKWAKTLLEKVEKLEAGKIATSRREKVLEKLKDADEKYRNRVLRDFDRMRIDSDEDFETVLSDIESDFSDFKQLQSDIGLGNDSPFGAFGNLDKGKPSDSEVESIVDSIL